MDSQKPVQSAEGTSDISTSRVDYEVFLSFRGSDTRNGFTDHLYVRLNDAGIRVYRDDEELRIGDKIGPELLKGINQSKIAIPIFSKSYAESRWCLGELAQIVECKRTTGLKVMPVFYDVTPSEVRNQTGNYKEAFESHEKRYDKETIASWKKALREIGELKGWDLQGVADRKEGELVKEVTNATLRELKKAYLAVADCLVGLDHHVKEVLNTLSAEINGVCIIGIYGMGGIGKTTLGKVVYNHLLPCFENHCFLANIREIARSNGIEFLQKKLISDILNKASTSISTIDEGIEIISERFPKKKVLLLMDDVDEISQLQVLIGQRNWFGSGSKIIITTRNKSILDRINVERSYELGGLDSDQALRLFSHHAFRQDKPPVKYATLSHKTVERAGGLPLALEVFGSLLCGNSKDMWDITVNKLENVCHKEIGAKLMISFEALDDHQKHIFLDIACFFIGRDKRVVIYFWDELQFPEEAIEVLQQMSLIKIQDDYSIWMHDQLRDLGREIVQKEHMRPEKRSRLWDGKEATKLFIRKMGSDNVEGINLAFYGKKEYFISIGNLIENFASLPNLKLLRVNSADSKHQCRWYKRIKTNNFFRKSPLILSQLRWLSWFEFPHLLNISNFSLEDLVILDLSWSRIKSSWSGWRRVKMAKNLKVLDLTACAQLVRTPDFSSHPKLEQIILKWCDKLEEIDESINMLVHLVVIDLRYCKRLQKLPTELSCTESLEELIIFGTGIVEIPNWPPMRRLRVFKPSDCHNLKTVGSLDFAANMTELCLDSSNITVLPDSIGNMVNLQKLSLYGCGGIKMLPESITDLESLIVLDLSFTEIVELPDTIGNLRNLKELRAKRTLIRELPTAIGMLENLVTLEVSYRGFLHDLPKLPQSSVSLEAMSDEMPRILDLSRLINLKNLELRMPYGGDCTLGADNPSTWWIGSLTSLERLGLGFGYEIILHADIGALHQLTSLRITSCDRLQSIPKLPQGLKDLYIEHCESLRSLMDLPSGLTDLWICDCKSLTILDLSSLRKLRNLSIERAPISKLKEIHNCESLEQMHINDIDLSDIDALEMLGNVIKLDISTCKKLQKLPDLSSLKKLGKLKVRSCPNLVEIPGRLESLRYLHLVDCATLERIPNIPYSETELEYFCIDKCGKLRQSLQQQSANTRFQCF